MMETEKAYQTIFDDYLSGKGGVDTFIERFMTQWRTDRDADTRLDERFQRLIDRVFTSCDCYSENPSDNFEISEEELRREVAMLRHIWFGS